MADHIISSPLTFDNNKLLYLEKNSHQPWLVFIRVLYPGRIGIWSAGLCGGEKPENLEKNPQSHARTTNSTYIWHWAGIKPRQHWWETSDLTTAPSLLRHLSRPRILAHRVACIAADSFPFSGGAEIEQANEKRASEGARLG